YYCRDFLQGYDYWRKHVSILEPKLIAKADLAVANSLFYAQYCSGHNPNSHYIGQGCDLRLFDPEGITGVPEDLRDLRGPVIGYVGAIDSARLDDEIIRVVARAHPEWNIVMVGPEDDYFRKT